MAIIGHMTRPPMARLRVMRWYRACCSRARRSSGGMGIFWTGFGVAILVNVFAQSVLEIQWISEWIDCAYRSLSR